MLSGKRKQVIQKLLSPFEQRNKSPSDSKFNHAVIARQVSETQCGSIDQLLIEDDNKTAVKRVNEKLKQLKNKIACLAVQDIDIIDHFLENQNQLEESKKSLDLRNTWDNRPKTFAVDDLNSSHYLSNQSFRAKSCYDPVIDFFNTEQFEDSNLYQQKRFIRERFLSESLKEYVQRENIANNIDITIIKKDSRSNSYESGARREWNLYNSDDSVSSNISKKLVFDQSPETPIKNNKQALEKESILESNDRSETDRKDVKNQKENKIQTAKVEKNQNNLQRRVFGKVKAENEKCSDVKDENEKSNKIAKEDSKISTFEGIKAHEYILNNSNKTQENIDKRVKTIEKNSIHQSNVSLTKNKAKKVIQAVLEKSKIRNSHEPNKIEKTKNDHSSKVVNVQVVNRDKNIAISSSNKGNEQNNIANASAVEVTNTSTNSKTKINNTITPKNENQSKSSKEIPDKNNPSFNIQYNQTFIKSPVPKKEERNGAKYIQSSEFNNKEIVKPANKMENKTADLFHQIEDRPDSALFFGCSAINIDDVINASKFKNKEIENEAGETVSNHIKNADNKLDIAFISDNTSPEIKYKITNSNIETKENKVEEETDSAISPVNRENNLETLANALPILDFYADKEDDQASGNTGYNTATNNNAEAKSTISLVNKENNLKTKEVDLYTLASALPTLDFYVDKEDDKTSGNTKCINATNNNTGEESVISAFKTEGVLQRKQNSIPLLANDFSIKDETKKRGNEEPNEKKLNFVVKSSSEGIEIKQSDGKIVGILSSVRVGENETMNKDSSNYNISRSQSFKNKQKNNRRVSFDHRVSFDNEKIVDIDLADHNTSQENNYSKAKKLRNDTSKSIETRDDETDHDQASTKPKVSKKLNKNAISLKEINAPETSLKNKSSSTVECNDELNHRNQSKPKFQSIIKTKIKNVEILPTIDTYISTSSKPLLEREKQLEGEGTSSKNANQIVRSLPTLSNREHSVEVKSSTSEEKRQVSNLIDNDKKNVTAQNEATGEKTSNPKNNNGRKVISRRRKNSLEESKKYSTKLTKGGNNDVLSVSKRKEMYLKSLNTT